MAWHELVVFSKPQRLEIQRMQLLSVEDCKAIQELVEYSYPKPEIPLPDEFTDVFAPKIIEGIFDEVSPFPYTNRATIALRILKGGKILQWSRLSLGTRYKDFQPFTAYRGHNGVVVRFIDPKWPLDKKDVPHCRRDCITHGGNQCAAFGSYCQIELSRVLPIWQDRCSAESAKTCPLRKGIWPKPKQTERLIAIPYSEEDLSEDPIWSEFKEWCKTRKGVSGKPRLAVTW
jgi:hypothetical protein